MSGGLTIAMIPGEMVNLRAVEQTDTPFIHRWLNEPTVMRGWGWSVAAMSLHAVAQWVEEWLATEPVLGRPVALIAETLDGDPVGLAVLRVDRPEARAVELSLLVGDPARWGQGLGADMLHTILDACFADWGIHRVGLRVEEDNLRALALYRRFGFHPEGRLRQAAFRDGRFHDILLFSLLADEWRHETGRGRNRESRVERPTWASDQSPRDTSRYPLEEPMLVPPENPIAVQLYTVREPARRDFPGTLQQLAEGGVRAVELAGYGGMAVDELASLLASLDIRVAGAHVPLSAWEERPSDILRDVVSLGGEYAVVPWLPEERRGSVGAARSLASSLDRWAALARDAGLGFAYHHHAFEFDPLPDGDGDSLFDVLVKETDPALVGFEIDVYWAAHAGVDPARLLRELVGRVPLVHLKDVASGPDRADAPAGTGILRWREILPSIAAAGAHWWIVEQDHPADPLADALLAVRNVEGMIAAP